MSQTARVEKAAAPSFSISVRAAATSAVFVSISGTALLTVFGL
jgi:hypothetical protein